VPSIELVGFDGDDTLWQSEQAFHLAHAEIRALLAPHCDPATLDRRLLDVERANLRLYGYGAKAFTLSVLETAVELAGERLGADDVRAILEIGKQLLAHPVELLDGVRDTITAAAERHRVVLVTKGDLFHQEAKVAGSGLGDLFDGVEIVAEKDTDAYRQVCARYGVAPERFVMVGNSLRSDVAPVLALGGWGIFVPHELTWALEHPDDEDEIRAHPRFRAATTIADVDDLLQEISGCATPGACP
jgi:putative hydrolase of the HAD superfamily